MKNTNIQVKTLLSNQHYHRVGFIGQGGGNPLHLCRVTLFSRLYEINRLENGYHLPVSGHMQRPKRRTSVYVIFQPPKQRLCLSGGFIEKLQQKILNVVRCYQSKGTTRIIVQKKFWTLVFGQRIVLEFE